MTTKEKYLLAKYDFNCENGVLIEVKAISKDKVELLDERMDGRINPMWEGARLVCYLNGELIDSTLEEGWMAIDPSKKTFSDEMIL